MRAFVYAVAIALVSLSIPVTPTEGFAQTPQQQATDAGITATGAIGEVKHIDPDTKIITLKTDAGSSVMASYNDKTTYKKLAPGQTSLTTATDIALTDVAVGDRIWARGRVAENRESLPAQMIVLMTKGDIAKKQEAERAEWRRRGILGVVTALKAETKEITIQSRTLAGTQSVIIPVTEKTEMHRYAPDSIKFSDAKPSTFGELKVGDQLRALGDRGTDPTHFTPQRVVTGSFRTIAGKVTAVDPATGEIKVSELEKKQALTIVVKQDSVLRKMPPAEQMGMMMGGMNRGGAPATGGSPPAGGTPAGGQPAARPQGGQGGPGAGAPGGARPGGGGFNINDMLERLPTITVAEVKVGDTIIVSSTLGADPTRLTAISLVSGADTLLAMLAPRPQPGQATPNPAAGLGGGGISFGIGLP
jgi:hypothetical protein